MCCEKISCFRFWCAPILRRSSLQDIPSTISQVDARNSVKPGSSRAAVTGYNFPLANRPKPAVKAGRRQARSQNIRPIRSHSCPRIVRTARKNFFAQEKHEGSVPFRAISAPFEPCVKCTRGLSQIIRETEPHEKKHSFHPSLIAIALALSGHARAQYAGAVISTTRPARWCPL